ncbi:MAG: hypothetical protein VYC32_14320 [Planctomycetota bacterium]|nr:hypothetical protein [Planctomycetota bacterium]
MRMLDSQVIYQKKTWNPRGLGCGIVLLVFFCAPWFFAYEVLLAEAAAPDWAPGLAWWQWLAAVVMGFFPLFVCTISFPLWFLVWRRTVRVTGTHLEIWRGPFKNLDIAQLVRLRLDKVVTVKQVNVDAMHSWALVNGNATDFSSESMPQGRNLASAPGLYCGPHALQLTDTDGQSFNVGTPDPDALAAVLMEARPGITLEETEPSGSN